MIVPGYNYGLHKLGPQGPQGCFHSSKGSVVVQVGRMVEKGQLLHVVRRLEALGPLTHGFHGEFMGISPSKFGESSPK